MFSATLHSDEVKDVAAKICQKPIVVDLKVLSVSRLQPSAVVIPSYHDGRDAQSLDGPLCLSHLVDLRFSLTLSCC